MRKKITLILLIILSVVCFGCSSKDQFINDNIYSNDFLEEHYKSENIHYELSIENDKTLKIDNYYCLQGYIELLCHYIKLDKANDKDALINDVKAFTYAYLISTNSSNKKVEVYIIPSGKVILICNDQCYESSDNAVDFNLFSNTIEFKELIIRNIEEIHGFGFEGIYHDFNNYRNDLDKNESFMKFKYSCYYEYLVDYLKEIDITLLSMQKQFYISNTSPKFIFSNIERESVDNEYLKVTPIYLKEIESFFNFIINKNCLAFTENESYYFISDNLEEIYASLLDILNLQIEDLNAKIESEWEASK